MKVRVRQGEYQAARPARPARLTTSGHGRVAQQQLGKPQPQALLADPSGAFQQQRLWQPAGGEGACQPVANTLMPVQGV
jgi:hypothetical protein